MPLASNYEEKTSMIKDNSVADKCVKKNYPPLKKNTIENNEITIDQFISADQSPL